MLYIQHNAKYSTTMFTWQINLHLWGINLRPPNRKTIIHTPLNWCPSRAILPRFHVHYASECSFYTFKRVNRMMLSNGLDMSLPVFFSISQLHLIDNVSYVFKTYSTSLCVATRRSCYAQNMPAFFYLVNAHFVKQLHI